MSNENLNAETTIDNPADLSTDVTAEKLPTRVLKVGSCPSLSGRSTLGYQIGVFGGELQLRLISTTGAGFYSKEWVPFASIDALLVADKALTFSSLQPLFPGRSVNTGGFLLAVLKGLGLVKPMEDNPRCHERGDIDGFLAELQQLITSNVSLGEDARPDAPKGRRKVITLNKPA